ncbi:MAG TPA: alpha/beta fold hydrolase [Candidatus Eisenbacteria bacterium]|nr:alpha/beta fold hydrolase [Candidatus Eisenbacteria bacterium]
MPFLDRDGVAVHYEPGTPNGRTPVLLTHGFGSSAGMWTPNLPALAAYRQVITWDIRGHGRSAAPDDPARYSEELSLGDMAAVLDAAGAGQAIVGGLSLGGYLSLAFHRRHPGRVAALLLFDTGPGYRRDEAREQWNRRVEETAAASPRALALAARGIMAQHGPDVIDSLPAIRVPTLVLVGADDRPFLAPADYMAAKIPGAVKVVLEGAGHVASADQPEAFDRAVLDFLAAID